MIPPSILLRGKWFTSLKTYKSVAFYNVLNLLKFNYMHSGLRMFLHIPSFKIEIRFPFFWITTHMLYVDRFVDVLTLSKHCVSFRQFKKKNLISVYFVEKFLNEKTEREKKLFFWWNGLGIQKKTTHESRNKILMLLW